MLKRDLSVYLVDGNNRYRLPVYSDLSYTQVYSETEIKQKTLHNPEKLITGAIVTYLNAGNFNFTVPIMDGVTAKAIFKLFFDLNSFNLYIKSIAKTIRLSTCVVESLVFNTAKDSIITASVSGSFKISDEVSFIPGVLQTPDTLYTYIQGIGVTLGSTIPYINGFNLELSNNVEWVRANYMQDTAPSYSQDFVIKERTISGNILAQSDITIPRYGTNSMLVQIRSNGSVFLTFQFPIVTYTTRVQLDDVTKEGIDFKINEDTQNKVLIKGTNIL